MARNAGGRLVPLDALRSVAVILVLFRHVAEDGYTFAEWPSAVAPVMRSLQRGGWVGVDLFFVLSGFLVSGLLFSEYQRTGQVQVGRFLVRRALKIYPAFYALLGYAIARDLIRARDLRWSALASEALFVQNYGPNYFWHTWSLAVEEHFYLLCATLVLVLTKHNAGRRDPYRTLPVITLAVATTCLGARLATTALAPYNLKLHVFPTHLRVDGLLFGVLLGYLYHFRRELLERWLLGRRGAVALIGAAAFTPALALDLNTPFIHTFGLTLFYLGSGLILLAAILGKPPESTIVRALAYLGTHSYSTYLWHLVVFGWVFRWMPLPNPLTVATFVAASFLVGIVMAKVIEFPVLRVRDRLFPPQTAPCVAALPQNEPRLLA